MEEEDVIIELKKFIEEQTKKLSTEKTPTELAATSIVFGMLLNEAKWLLENAKKCLFDLTFFNASGIGFLKSSLLEALSKEDLKRLEKIEFDLHWRTEEILREKCNCTYKRRID